MRRVWGGAALAAGGATLLAVLMAAGCGREKPDAIALASAAPCRELDRAFQPLRRDFEGETGKVRVVAIVSPTCGRCQEAVEDMHTSLLPRMRSQDLVVFVVWASLMPPDVATRAGRLATMYSDPQMVHYFDDTGRIARTLGPTLGAESGRSIYDVHLLYDRRATWDPEAAMRDEPRDFDALAAGWSPATPRARMGEHALVRMPAFDVRALEQMVRQLLAEDG